jgi:hypothetical protein
MMADHAKCGINTMFNTGTVVGVGANIFGAGFPRNFIPSFSWGGPQGLETFVLNKFFKTAEAVCKRRNITLNEIDKNILKRRSRIIVQAQIMGGILQANLKVIQPTPLLNC